MVGLKPNQPTLFDEAENFMEQAREVLPDEAGVEVYLENIANDGHGRSVEYTCTVCNDLGWLRDSMEHQGGKEMWSCLKGLIAVRSVTTTLNTEAKPTVFTRYYLSTAAMNAANAHRYIRSHWAIEVTLHQILDVTIQEDAHRSSKDH